MPQARVYNDHPEFGKTAYSEKFRDETLTIPPMGHIVMERSEAALFLGQFRPIKKLDNGTPIGPKALREEVYYPCSECKHEAVNEEKLKTHLRDEHLKMLVTSQIHRCHLCKEEFGSEENLLVHGVDKHNSVLVDDEVKRRPKKG